jgi:hypothetical protein
MLLIMGESLKHQILVWVFLKWCEGLWVVIYDGWNGQRKTTRSRTYKWWKTCQIKMWQLFQEQFFYNMSSCQQGIDYEICNYLNIISTKIKQDYKEKSPYQGWEVG